MLAEHAAALGGDFAAYRNHVCRVLNFCRALEGGDDGLPEALAVAAACHDLGIWTARTFDYLEPSVVLAAAELACRGRSGLLPEAAAIIRNHHKLSPYRGQFAARVEAFRLADRVDLSLGALRAGLPRDFVAAVRAAFPNAGFHRRLAQLTARQFARSPWRPLPMMRW